MAMDGKKKPSEHTVFVLAANDDCGVIARALRRAGYGLVIDPATLDGDAKRRPKDAPKIVWRDLERLERCTMVVTGPGAETLTWGVAIAAVAGTARMPFEMIERIDPEWRTA